MREKRRKPKVGETTAIPQNLVLFLSDVHRKIIEQEEETTIESDDLLQDERTVGGLIDAGSAKYGFTYFCDTEGIRNNWEIVLDAEDIARVTRGEKKELRLWACADPACGCKFSDDSGSCFYCDWVEAQGET